MPVGGRQLADALHPVAHDPCKVARVVQASHNDAVEVHRLDEVAEESALQSQHVPARRKSKGEVSGIPVSAGDAELAAHGPFRELRL